MTEKLFLSIFLVLFLWLISSCSSEDGDVVGTYQIVSLATTNCDDPFENFSFNFESKDGCDSQLGLEICGDGHLTLTADETFTFSLTLTVDGDSSTMTSSGTYSVNGNTITTCDGAICEDGNFDLGSGRIALSYTDDSCIVTISGKK